MIKFLVFIFGYKGCCITMNMKIRFHYFLYCLTRLPTKFIRYSNYSKTFLTPDCWHTFQGLPLLQLSSYSFYRLLLLTLHTTIYSGYQRWSQVQFIKPIIFHCAPKESFESQQCIFEDFYLFTSQPSASQTTNSFSILSSAEIMTSNVFLAVLKIAIFVSYQPFQKACFDWIWLQYIHQLFRQTHLFLSSSLSQAPANSTLASFRSCIANQNPDFICYLMSYFLFLLGMPSSFIQIQQSFLFNLWNI